MNDLRARLAATGPEASPLLLDGGLGSMLIDRGLARGQAPEQWNVDRPEDVTEVHRAYVDAGSEAVHTNTFGGTPIRLAAFGLAERCDELNRAGVELARQAGPTFVLADVGPTGEYLPPVGTGDEAAWREAFLAQAQALADAGVDGFHVETMSDLREARAALTAIREIAPSTPVLVSLTFDRKRRGFFTVMGNRLVESLCELAEQGATAVGANCSITSEDMQALVTEAAAGLQAAGHTAALVVQANAGLPQMTPEGVRYDQSPQAFAADTAAMARAGARIVGGCCGTDPEFIRALRQQLAAPA